LEKEVEHWKTRYEVAQAYIDIVREEEEREIRAERNRRRNERQKRKKKKQKKGTSARSKSPQKPQASSQDAGTAPLAVIDGGADAGDRDAKPDAVEE
jgi:hypothetical protein